jgi:hypothetical protein
MKTIEPDAEEVTMKDPLPEMLLTASDLDKVEVHFDWRSTVENGRILFQADLVRGDKYSAIRFEIDLLRLNQPELTQLYLFLERRHSGVTTHYEMARILYWLVDCSIVQAQTGWNKSLRDSKIRELLLYGQARSD